MGATATSPPAGYATDRPRISLGNGESIFLAAKAALRRWELFRLGWVELWSPDTPIQSGEVVAIMAWTAAPCPMYQAAILWTGIETVVFGTSIRSLQRLGWRQIDILAEEVVRRSPAWNCTLIGGVMERECDALFYWAICNRKRRT